MALKPTIYKTRLQLADSDRNQFESLTLTLAQHPSETLERMTARLIAFCMNWEPRIEFTRGLSSTDEPAIWLHTDTGEIDHWIDVGQPDEARLRKACGRTLRVSVYAFGNSATTWWNANGNDIAALPRLSAYQFSWDDVKEISKIFNARTVALNVSIVGGTIYLDDGEANFSITPSILHDRE
jgi:uncharacterized protein YaeQ